MKKRIFALFLVAVLILSLVACGGEPSNPSTSDSVGAGSESSVVQNSDASTDENTDASTDKQAPVKSDVYDSEMEHKFIVTDDIRNRLVVYDLSLCDGDFTKLAGREAVVWEWNWDDDPFSKHPQDARWGLDSAKYRYSPYYEKDVVIACASSGWVGVIDYEAKVVLWEDDLGRGPHSVEMLPNGDLIVAVSTENANRLVYYALSIGAAEKVHEIPADYPHGVCWDPKNECIWVSEFTGVFCVEIEGMGSPYAKIIRLEGRGAAWDGNTNGGHAFAPIMGEPGKYWASTNHVLQVFDAETQTLTATFPRSGILSKNQIKGCCSFADGTVVEIVTHQSSDIRIITREKSSGKISVAKDVETIVNIPDSGFYKVQVFTKNYQ